MTFGLHHLERIGRRHQHLRQQRIGIERDRRQQLVELFRLEQRLVRCGRRRRRRCLGEHDRWDDPQQGNHDQSRQPGHHAGLLFGPQIMISSRANISQSCPSRPAPL